MHDCECVSVCVFHSVYVCVCARVRARVCVSVCVCDKCVRMCALACVHVEQGLLPKFELSFILKVSKKKKKPTSPHVDI